MALLLVRFLKSTASVLFSMESKSPNMIRDFSGGRLLGYSGSQTHLQLITSKTLIMFESLILISTILHDCFLLFVSLVLIAKIYRTLEPNSKHLEVFRRKKKCVGGVLEM